MSVINNLIQQIEKHNKAPWTMIDIKNSPIKDIQYNIDKTAIIEKYTTIKNNVIIGANSIIKSGSIIEGPVVIGNNCVIGPNCYIRPVTFIEDTARVRFSSEIRNSIIRSGTMIDHLSFIGDSIIGKNCNIGAGTIIANQRYDLDEIWIEYDNISINTHRKFLGAIIGDNVITTIGSRIDCGSVIKSNTIIRGNFNV